MHVTIIIVIKMLQAQKIKYHDFDLLGLVRDLEPHNYSILENYSAWCRDHNIQ